MHQRNLPRRTIAAPSAGTSRAAPRISRPPRIEPPAPHPVSRPPSVEPSASQPRKPIGRRRLSTLMLPRRTPYPGHVVGNTKENPTTEGFSGINCSLGLGSGASIRTYSHSDGHGPDSRLKQQLRPGCRSRYRNPCAVYDMLQAIGDVQYVYRHVFTRTDVFPCKSLLVRSRISHQDRQFGPT